MSIVEEWRVSWTMWPFGHREPTQGERITQDEADARDQLEGLRGMLAPHPLRPCDVHVWEPKLEHRTIEQGPWVPLTGGDE